MTFSTLGRILLVVSLAGFSTVASANAEPGQGETGSTAPDASAFDPDMAAPQGGPGAGNNPNRDSLSSTFDTATPDAAPTPDKDSVVAVWFNQLSSKDQKKFLANAVQEGLVSTNGDPFTPRQFNAMSAFLDDELTRQGLDDAAKITALEMIARKPAINAAAN